MIKVADNVHSAKVLFMLHSEQLIFHVGHTTAIPEARNISFLASFFHYKKRRRGGRPLE